MAMTMKVTGLEDLSRMLESLEDKAPEVAAKALYEGAGTMADAYSQAVNNIQTEKFRYAFGGQKRYPSPEEKAALVGKIGITKFDKNGSEVQTSIGISGAGYVTIAGKKKAVRQIANAINSGTSFMAKQPFYRRAVSQSKGQALGKIETKLREELDKLGVD